MAGSSGGVSGDICFRDCDLRVDREQFQPRPQVHSIMTYVLIGVNHRTAPVEVREQFAIPEARLPEAMKALTSCAGVEEGMIVSTCNRVEILARTTDEGARLDEFFQEFYGFDADRYRTHLYEHRDRDAVRHVFRVASSLDSMIVGEPQILGQVKEAYARRAR